MNVLKDAKQDLFIYGQPFPNTHGESHACLTLKRFESYPNKIIINDKKLKKKKTVKLLYDSERL